MSYYQYEMEARMRQSEKIEQARQWRLAQEARGRQVQQKAKGISLLTQLRAVLSRAGSYEAGLREQGLGIKEC